MPERKGGSVRFPANGRTAGGYLARAEGGGPGVVVIQEWWGLVPHVEDLAERFAAAGFNALAPDLYHGEKARSPDQAGKLMMALRIDQAAADLHGAIRHLLADPTTTSRKVGVVGFCMGGQLALHAGCAFPAEVGAVVDFYGIHPAVKPELDRLEAPFLGFFAERDKGVPPEQGRTLQAELERRGKKAEVEVIPGADHAFFNDTRPEVYDPEAARRCWDRMVAFFRRSLA